MAKGLVLQVQLLGVSLSHQSSTFREVRDMSRTTFVPAWPMVKGFVV